MSRARIVEITCLLALCAVGLFLRGHDLEAFGLSPDDGNYLHSAGVLRIERGPDKPWYQQDQEWYEGHKSYRHSYLHQYAIRWLTRMGAGKVVSVRLDSAILGALTPWLLFLLIAGKDRERRKAGLIAAAMLSVYVMHVWYSRTGWGQIGCTFFFTAYLLFADRLFHDSAGRNNGRTALLAAGMMVSALAAYGYHEMIVVHVAGMGLYSVLHLYWSRGEPGSRERKIALAAFAIACIPVTAWGLTLLNDEFAQKHWSGLVQEKYKRDYFEYRFWILKKLVRQYGLHERIGWVVLPLSLVGMRALWKSNRILFRYLFTMFLVSWVTFFFAFRDPYLIRVYLPTFVLMVGFSAFGAQWLVERVAPGRRGLAWTGVGAALLLMLSQSVATVFGEKDSPVTISSFYTPFDVPHRDPLGPITDYLLANRKPGEIMGISGDRAPEYTLMDRGISSRAYGPRSWNKPLEEQATWVLSGQKLMEKAGRTVETGGHFELVVTDTTQRLGLYRVRRP